MDGIRRIWKSADCVCLDVDSTVILDEGIDMLAEFFGKGAEVAKLTAGAMQGKTSYKSSLEARLNLFRPSRAAINQFIEENPPAFTPRVEALVMRLQEKNVPVYLISGGFRCIIEPIAAHLQIPMTNVFANQLLFNSAGEYIGFDEQQPTCRDNGKAVAIQQLKDKFGYRRLVHIGDGVTDLEACPPADAFIGFGGNQVRERVKNEAQWFVMDFSELIESL